MEENIDNLTKDEKYSIDFYHLFKEILKKKIIYHLKTVIQASLNQERNWEWYHFSTTAYLNDGIILPRP